MSDHPVSVVLSALDSLTGRKPTRNGPGWKARCPAHDDKRPSLSVSEGEDGRALVYCHAGCPVEAIAKALGLAVRDLMPPCASPSPRPVPRRDSAGKGDGGRQKTFKTAAEAVAELERRCGRWSARWVYQDAKSEPVGVVVRWDRPGGGKDIRPVSRTPDGWIIRGMPTPRPLYQLPTLADAKRVYICEGEKTADAVISLGLIATTSPHGSQAASSADWSPLAGKECIILPDYDRPGEKYAADVVAELAKLTPAPTVRVLHLDKLPPGGDAYDFIEDYRSAGVLDDDAVRAHLERWANRISPVELDTPGLAVEAFQPFPVNVLPEPVRSFVAKGAQAIGCDPSFVALPVLAALAAAIGNTRRIQLKRGWSEPSAIWTAIVGESGTQKTPAFRLALRALRDLQAKSLKEHAGALGQYERDLLDYEKALRAWKQNKNDHDDPPDKLVAPQAVRFIVSDTTTEALAPILLANWRGVLLARDELAGWIGSFDRYAQERGGDSAHWLSMHAGESMIVDRKTGQPRTIYVPRALVSVTGGIQPRILDRALATEHRESGLAARLLLTCPPRTTKRWTEADIDPELERRVAEVFARLLDLQPGTDDDGDPTPLIVRLTSEAKSTWITFYNAHAREQAELTGDEAAAWSKLEGYTARLALVLHCVRWAASDATLGDPNMVDQLSITAGIALSQWFGHEALRVYALLSESDDARRQRRLIEVIEHKGGAVSVRDWQRTRSHKTAGDAEAELNELVEAGYGRWNIPPQTGRGRPTRRFVLALDRADTDTNLAGGPETGIVSVSEAPDSADTIPDRDGVDAGCPVDELPSNDARFAGCLAAEGWTPEAQGTVDDEWGEL